jgi:hypothetical protein
LEAQIAYHALFYTHLYLQPAEADFVPWEHHRPALPRPGRRGRGSAGPRSACEWFASHPAPHRAARRSAPTGGR